MIDIKQFNFQYKGNGLYKVSFTEKGKTIYAFINDRNLIDATINCEYPQQRNLEKLKEKIENQN